MSVNRAPGTPPRPAASWLVPPAPRPKRCCLEHTQSIQPELYLGRAQNGKQLPKHLENIFSLSGVPVSRWREHSLFVGGDAPSGPMWSLAGGCRTIGRNALWGQQGPCSPRARTPLLEGRGRGARSYAFFERFQRCYLRSVISSPWNVTLR